jgi:serine/threonine protein kinase
VLVDVDGCVKITDFGIAKIMDQTVTQTGVTMGSPSYMSPEQIRAVVLDGRSDQFSLAVVAYETLTGRLPFEAPTLVALQLKIATEDPLPAYQVKPALPVGVSNVLRKGFATRPEQRFATCTQLVDALARALVTAPEIEVSPPDIIRFSSDVDRVAPGGQFTLLWETRGATEVALDLTGKPPGRARRFPRASARVLEATPSTSILATFRVQVPTNTNSLLVTEAARKKQESVCSW